MGQSTILMGHAEEYQQILRSEWNYSKEHWRERRRSDFILESAFSGAFSNDDLRNIINGKK